MSSQSPYVEGSDTEQRQPVVEGHENGVEQVAVGVRESADGGASPQQPGNDETAEDDGGPKETSNSAIDLDKDIDAVLEYNVQNGQVNPDLSVTIDSIPVDSTLDSTKNVAEEEESGADGMPSLRHDGGQQPLGGNIDENGNVETIQGETKSSDKDEAAKTKEAGSDKSFTSDTDSSVVAETLVRNALNVAMTAMESEDSAPVSKGPQEADQEIDAGVAMPAAIQGDIKVGLFQYNMDDDYQAENGGYEDEDSDNEEDEPDVQVKQKDSDAQVGLFQYQESYDAEPVKSPNVSEVETIEDQIESLTEEERADIMKLYGLDRLEPISPKSPTDNNVAKTEIEEGKDDQFIDVQREVYEAQTKKFVIMQDPSSTESTPRNGADNLKVLGTKPPEGTEGPNSLDSEKDLKDGLSDRESMAAAESESRNEIEKLEIGDDKVSPYIESSLSQDIAPPLVQYEPVKENGKFRIVKTSKERGGSSYSSIRVGKDVSTPEQSPRSGSEDGQKSDRSLTGSQNSDRSLAESQISDRSQSGAFDAGVDRSQMYVQSPPAQVVQNDRNKHCHGSEQEKLIKETSGGQERLPIATEDAEVSLASSLRSQSSDKRGADEYQITDLNNIMKSKSPIAASRDVAISERPRDMSPHQLSVSELQRTSDERHRAAEVERDRIKYTTRNTDGVETRRMGPVPYDGTQDHRPATSTRVMDGRYPDPYQKERQDFFVLLTFSLI